ncbi:hypothetical protein E4T49_01689 [Aureobasidium sp. EXF-10728]|nr:hypothetical protein E4T49_01689 [Aureobasidium sp. EXF-10728]
MDDIETQLAMDLDNAPSLDTTSLAATDAIALTPSLDSHSTVSGGFAIPVTPTVDVNIVDTSELYADFLKNLLDNGSSEALYPPAMSADDFGIGFWDDYLDANMSLGRTAEVHIPSPQVRSGVPTVQAGSRECSRDTSTLEQKALRAAANAFEQSGWNWSPSSDNHRSAEHGGLSLPHDWTRQEGLPQPDADFSAKRLRPTDRERVMGLLLTYCSKQHLARMVSTFPSVGSLDGLVHRFLRSQTSRHEPWIHVATFDPTSIRPELLAAVLAHGACSTSAEVIRKLGYAMIDIVRTAVIDSWHGDNSLSRDLQLLQALLLTLNLAMWSGNKCMMEIAESTMGPSITIIRRAGWLREEFYSRIEPCEADQEMTLPYPEGDHLWSAIDADSWKAQHFKHSNQAQEPRTISLADDMRTLINEGSNRAEGDATWRNTALLHGIWRLIWGHREVEDLLQTSHPDGVETSSLLPSRGEGLTKVLNKVRSELELGSTVRSTDTHGDSILIHNFLNMALHAPIQSLQAFAGKDGVAAAQRVYPMLEEWTQSKSSRRAVWYAGQLIQAARNTSTRSICDWRVVIVYHTSLVFWAYGIICSIRQKQDMVTDTAPDGKKTVCLDQEYDATMRRFINLGDGEPCLLSQSVPDANHPGSVGSIKPQGIPLRQASQIMQILACMLTEQTSGLNEKCLPLTDSFVRLMNELARSAKATMGA